MHLVHIPDMGATFLERLKVPVASLAFGLLRFIVSHLYHNLRSLHKLVSNRGPEKIPTARWCIIFTGIYQRSSVLPWRTIILDPPPKRFLHTYI